MLAGSQGAAFESPGSASRERRMEALLAFEAPYLSKKLVRLGLADSEARAGELFLEVKRYLALAALRPEEEVPMFSTRVDQVWHEFVLFTREYAAFCSRHVGRFMHHSPLEAAAMALPEARQPPPPMTFVEFRAAYESLFGALSPIWHDELALGPGTRLGWGSWAAPFAVAQEGERAVLLQARDPRRVLCRAGGRARAALGFIAEHRFFLVRELPELVEGERLELCRPLVESRILTLV